jgi:hypothetical protein
MPRTRPVRNNTPKSVIVVPRAIHYSHGPTRRGIRASRSVATWTINPNPLMPLRVNRFDTSAPILRNHLPVAWDTRNDVVHRSALQAPEVTVETTGDRARFMATVIIVKQWFVACLCLRLGQSHLALRWWRELAICLLPLPSSLQPA